MVDSINNEPKEGSGVLKAATELAKAVPIYQDLLQPAAKELGQGLKTIAKTVNVALAPVSALVWGYDQMKEFVSTRVSEKLKHTPPENIITPEPSLAGPLLESLRYTGSNETLSDMYASLLASAMDRETSAEAHPSFVELIKQMTSDDAKVMAAFKIVSVYPLIHVRSEMKDGSGGFIHTSHINSFDEVAKLDRPKMTPYYVDNLRRLGLIEIPVMSSLAAQGIYDKLENCECAKAAVEEIEKDPGREARIQHLAVRLTPMGHLFIKACVS
jgi:hypothetical protein